MKIVYLYNGSRWLTLLCVLSSFLIGNSSGARDVFTRNFLVHTDGRDSAHKIAKRHNMEVVGNVMGDASMWQMVDHSLPHARTKRSIYKHKKLRSDPDVKFVTQVIGYKREKRGYNSLNWKLKNIKVDSPGSPTDPMYHQQWYLKNTGQGGGKKNLDLNVEKAWALGYTGKHVTTAIMDDGIDYMHPDIINNFNAKASYDFSSNDPWPYPRYTDDWFNSHGTRCAGEIVAARDNDVCGVGVAYDSKVAGIRMLDQPYMTDLIEAHSMSHEPNLVDIYSASWGPTDDGKTVDGPRNATMRAIVKGVNEGRRGLGNIFVWASGDGGDTDDCNCDGYAASMWTISINSAINTGGNARYDESCSSTLASTFSNGGRSPELGVATTDLYGDCTLKHSGTSAAAPEAAGVYALALEANPKLTWRDLQHLTVLTSSRNSLNDEKCREMPDLHIETNFKRTSKKCQTFEWLMNGVSLEYNHLFGFGVLDAGEIVMLAKVWKTVPPRFHCTGGHKQIRERIPREGQLEWEMTTDGCDGKPTEVNYLEHVQSVVTLNSTRRGDTTLYLISPKGTESMILSPRPKDDDSTDGFTNWPFMTTHMWGENPRGTWKLIARFQGRDHSNLEGFVSRWTLELHGTAVVPYEGIEPLADHKNSKLATVKKAHKRLMG